MDCIKPSPPSRQRDLFIHPCISDVEAGSLCTTSLYSVSPSSLASINERREGRICTQKLQPTHIVVVERHLSPWGIQQRLIPFPVSTQC